MNSVPLTSLTLPDWGWHADDTQETAKLTTSLRKHGQLVPLIVRQVNDTFEIIDGRRRLNILRQLGAETVWIKDLGPISRNDAIKVAMSLELGTEVDYAKLAWLVKEVSSEDDFASLPMSTPFTLERLAYFCQLTTFDWSQYATVDEQVSLWEDDDGPAPPVQKAPVVAEAPRAKTATAQEQALAIAFGDDNSVPEIEGWRASEPPCLDGVSELELDTETTGLKWWEKDRPIGISLRLPDGRKMYLPWGHTGGNLDEAVVKRWAQRELRNKHITNHSIKFDNHMLHAWGVDLEEQGCTLSDVQHYAAILDEYRKEFALDVLGKDFVGQEKIKGLDKSRMASYHASQVAAYAEQDVHLVHELKGIMWPLMEAEGLHKVRQLEDDVIYPVCEMERNAAHVDRAQLHAFVEQSARMLDEMLFEVAREVGFQVNPDKNADLVRLFDHLGLKEPGRTAPSTKFPTGQPSFADALLEKIDNRLVQIVRRAGKLASLRSKFLVPYADVVGSDSKLRFALHQLRGDEYGTVRGRFSMSGEGRGIGKFGANLQQVFRVNSQRQAFGYAHDDSSHDHEIFLVRSLFVAEPFVRDDGSDTEYLSADAQSIEYRLAAHFAESNKLIDAYQADFDKLKRGELTGKWVDFHGVVGDVIRPHKDLSRNIIKNANFCLVYRGGKDTAARTLGMDRAMSDPIVDIWHRMFPEFSTLGAKAEGLARNRGYVKTILGRRARFGNEEQLKWAHAAINYVIQGSAADVMKTKLVELHKARKQTGFLMRMTVHDEVDGDARDPRTAEHVRQILNQQSFNLRVPIVWEVETGKNWAVAH